MTLKNQLNKPKKE